MILPAWPRFPAGQLLFLALAGCGGTGMPLSFQRTIPRDAAVIHLQSGLAPGDLFDSARTILSRAGYGFPRLDAAARSLETDALPVGSSKSPLRISLRVRPDDAGAVLDATGQTLVGPGMWGPATNGGDHKSKLGFQELVMLMGRIPNRQVSYSPS